MFQNKLYSPVNEVKRMTGPHRSKSWQTFFDEKQRIMFQKYSLLQLQNRRVPAVLGSIGLLNR